MTMTTLPRPQLFLIDGYAVIYRAFFAMIGRPLTTGKGENTSAAWGVASFLLRIRERYKPDYLVWVHDAGSSFRKETYPEYKATREKLDEELQDTFDRSVERIVQLLDAFHVPLVAVDGYEADDVIGTLASRASQEGVHTVIVSGDKDFYQLIGREVSLLNPGRGGPASVQEEFVTEANARDRLGVPPERVIDYLALVGDSSDNVPGVRGIGDKTARKLIDEFGDLDAILQRAGEVTAKRAREALESQADEARLSRDLVTIMRNVPVELDFESVRTQEPDAQALRALFTELEFYSLVDKVSAEAPEAKGTAFAVVASPSEVAGIVARARAAELVTVATHGPFGDSHARGLDGLSVAVDDATAWYFPLGHRAPDGDLLNNDAPPNLPPLAAEVMRPLAALLEDAGVPKAGHNVKRDWLRLRTAGVELRGACYDSMVASFLLDPGRRSHALSALCLDHLGVPLPGYTDVIGKGKKGRPFAEVSVAEAGRYSCQYSAAVHAVKRHFHPQLESTRLLRLLDDIEMPLIEVLVEMEWTGITLDTDRLGASSARFREEMQSLERSIYEEAGTEFNINSTLQLRHILFGKLQLPIIKKTKTGPSTDADVLAQLASTGFEVPKLLLEYRELAKLRSTYIDALPRSVNPATNRVHTTFHQTGAATGRLSSSDPNLQNIPVRTERGAEIRRCFVPAPGCSFVAADYSQVELRILAHLSEDAAFIEAFQRGGDIHRETAAIIFDILVDEVTSEMRARAKTINFATIYGQGPFALARQLEITQDEAKEFIATYFERFAGVRTFLDRTIQRAKEVGYVETLFGRRRYIPELKDKNFNVRAFGERTAMNSPIQGSAADLIKIAMINLHRALESSGTNASILLQVHDELILEAPNPEAEQVAAIVRTEMINAGDLNVPLVVDVGIGPNWLDAKQ
ncbi:MAG: DNA polymerase I [Gemmatimonadetes bacterium]|nr:DNA polymerase I [Gemmatimonadota bacterium]